MPFVKVAQISDVPAGRMKRVVAGDKEILIANLNGKLYAIGNLCTHMKGNLSEGVLEGNMVTCPRHGSKFDIITGKSMQGPKVAFLKLKGKDEPSYETKVEGADILVKID